MTEFVVELFTGKRLIIRADRCVPQYEGAIHFLVDSPESGVIDRFDNGPNVVAVVDQRQVVWIADREHLIGEERWSPASGSDEPPGDQSFAAQPGAAPA